MKRRHVVSYRTTARETLENCGITVGADFHTLRASQVDALLKAADRAKYKKPPNANGSRARYFHDLIQRRAAMKTE